MTMKSFLFSFKCSHKYVLQTMELRKSQEVIDLYIILYDFPHFFQLYLTATLNQLILYLSVNIL